MFGYTLALYGLNMYHAYRALPRGEGQTLSLAALAWHAATDNGMKVMGAGMVGLLFFAQPG